jgi:hypothetical protein
MQCTKCCDGRHSDYHHNGDAANGSNGTTMIMTIMIILMLILCFGVIDTTSLSSTPTTTYTLGLIVATYANRSSDIGNLRYLSHCRQAIADVSSGYVQLSPSLPSTVNITLAEHSSYATATGALLSTSIAIEVI